MQQLKSIVKGSMLENELMSKHTSYGIGGPVSAYIRPKDRSDLEKILKFAQKNQIPAFFIGSGSNLLVSDKGVEGIIISPSKSLKNLEIKGNYVTAESGVMLGKMVKECVNKNLTGLETLIGVPGTLGGALVMNAGAFGSEISNYLINVENMNLKGQIKIHNAQDISFGYRFSSFKDDEIILLARFKLQKEDSDIIQNKKNKASQGRRTNQPLKFRSSGSVFKNPENNHAAGYLIDKAGLKGTRIGNAEISHHHANFFINHGNASASDITSLIRIARKAVFKKYGLELELELKTIGIKEQDLKENA